MNETRRHRWGVALAVVAACGFSFKAILIKLAYPYGVDAVTLLTMRMAFALPVFLWVGFSSAQGAPPLDRRDWLKIAALGMLGYYGASLLDFLGLQYISAGLERLILFTYPMLTLLLGVALHGRAIRRREMLAMLLCYAGIAAAFAHDLRFAGDPARIWLGAGFVFASAVSYACYLSGSGAMIVKLGSARFTALAMLFSTLVTCGHFFTTHTLQSFIQPWPVVAYGVAMATVSTVLPVFALSMAIRQLGSSRAAMIGMVGPLITVVFGWLLLGEAFSATQMLGLGLVVLGIGIASRQ
ncbi:MAG TPA: DMT family transporter [Rhodocyclaceae bacterium]|nr:DMT family transporter [Rhodocyclaceae bacterium]